MRKTPQELLSEASRLACGAKVTRFLLGDVNRMI